MLARRVISHLKPSSVSQFSSSSKGLEEGKSRIGRKAVSFILITVTGGVALSALDDLAIYQSCSRKAMEKARTNKAVIEALGEPIKKGPWYDASLAVAHKRRTVSCTFPVSGPRGNGMLQLKAVRNGDDSWFSYLLHPLDWEILIMDALLHVPENEEQKRTFRVSLTDVLSPACDACTSCPSPALKSSPQ